MTIGFAFDTPRDGSTDPTVLDSVAAEYEDEATLDWIRRQLGRFGTVVDLPWGRESAARILAGEFDLVFNITEGEFGRNRESHVPGICELAETPCTGSDSLALGLSLDKEYTKILARNAGIPTPRWARIRGSDEIVRGRPMNLRYPAIVKPVTGGSSMGVHQFSRVTTDAELSRAVEWVLEECRDDALVEEFVPGREFVAGILRGSPEVTLPVAELTFPEGGPDAFYSVEWKSRHEKVVVCPADIPGEIETAMQVHTERLFELLGAADLCRADFRLAADGTPYFIEMNPLPGLSPFYSVFPMQVRAAGEEPGAVIERLVRNACERGGRTAGQNGRASRLTSTGRIRA